MSGLARDRRGASVGDVLIFLATVSIAAALLYPAWSVRGFRAVVEQAVADADTLSAAATRFRDQAGRWPTTGPPGEAPRELANLEGAGGVFSRQEYRVGWSTWEVVDSVEAPPMADSPSADDAPRADAEPVYEPVVRSVGAVTIRSSDSTFLAELLHRHADEASFVIDSIWVLVLPERAGPLESP